MFLSPFYTQGPGSRLAAMRWRSDDLTQGFIRLRSPCCGPSRDPTSAAFLMPSFEGLEGRSSEGWEVPFQSEAHPESGQQRRR